MGYDSNTVNFFKESDWIQAKSKLGQRNELGLLYMPLWVNREQWDILKDGGCIPDIFDGNTNHPCVKFLRDVEICDVILKAQYDI